MYSMSHMNSFLNGIILSIILLLLVCSCHRQHERQELRRLVEEWQGREVLFPNDMVFTSYVRNTVEYDVFDSPFKLFHYVDTTDCFSCKLRLRQWSGLIEELRALVPGRVAFLLCLFLGPIGAHKFYEGKVGMGCLYLLTGGLLGIGWLADIFIILGKNDPYWV